MYSACLDLIKPRNDFAKIIDVICYLRPSEYEEKFLITILGPRYIWEDNIKRDLTETEYVGVNDRVL
jgi:hypothetical protein